MACSMQTMEDGYSCPNCSSRDDDEMVQCDTCNAWYHFACAGANITEDIANYPWDCKNCVTNQFRKIFMENPAVTKLIRSDGVESTSSQVTMKGNEEKTSIKSKDKQNFMWFIEEKQKLEEEQMNKSFEIRRKFLREKFSVMCLDEEEEAVEDKGDEVVNDLQDENEWPTTQVYLKPTQTERPSTTIQPELKTPLKQLTRSIKESECLTKFSQTSTPFFQDTQIKDRSTVHQQSDEQRKEYLFSTFSNNIRDHDLGTSSHSTIKPNEAISGIQGMHIQDPSRQLNAISTTKTLTPDQIAARHVLPRDLPKFQGSPKEWPMFISSFQSSTNTGGYSNAENLIRLQRCLQGKALEAVRSILLTPDNVPNVIETLRMLYGRADLVIFTLIQQLKEEPPPKVEKLETLINFALVVHNLCSIIKITKLQAHMNNPYLMQEIMDKLPSNLKLEWSRHKRTIPNASMEDLGKWLYEVAQAASEVITPVVSYNNKGKPMNNKKEEVKPKQNQYFQASHKEDEKKDYIPTKCKICFSNCTKVENCKKFQEFSVKQRWNAVKEHKLCSTCLKVHRRFQCKDKRKCKEFGCDSWHHILLHPNHTKATTAVHHIFRHNVIYRILPVMLHGPLSTIRTFAYLDGGSGITLMEEKLAQMVGVEGQFDSAEDEALTRNHFLFGGSGRLPIPCEISENEKFLSNNWKTGQQLINHFWTRWVREYLPTITRRTKWFTDVKPIEVGDIVYIVDETLKRNMWPKGRVMSVFPGKNNVIRSALVLCNNKEYHRPVAKLAVLDIRPPAPDPHEVTSLPGGEC
ncbi:hypothetical protein Bhyg_09625 [Pseudolycoriella hygida]|uniref:PHD-type domain-containing protein n=1 Tax=Pseudolycoriella hygida TaxID=35572 RepID=A0A9Q0N6S3_9DIPT|nr:hypothetical protein Bhyg_09625 [Pseudolycoriella hygida]